MVKKIQGAMEEVKICSESIINYMNSLLGKYYNKVIELNFQIIEGHLFLFTEIDNGSIMNKNNLNIDVTDLSSLYLNLYELFKSTYLNLNTTKISVLEVTNLIDMENPYLILNIRDVHRNIIKIELKDLGHEKETLNEIKSDWISEIEKSSKAK